MAESILVVDDSHLDTTVINRLLSDYRVMSAGSGDEMWKLLEAETPSIILLDVVLPGDDGFALAERLSKHERYADIPIIFITSKDTGGDVARGFESGGFDYIKKPYTEKELRARIRSALDTKRRERELREKTVIDPLTGVYNRRYFFEALEKIVEHTRRNRRNIFALALIDIDHFKHVNDRHGHQAGDSILAELADCLRTRIRPYDILARYGGEEFVVIFKDCGRAASGEVLQRIKDFVEGTPCRFRDEVIHVTFSGGIADIGEVPPDAPAAGELLRMADERLYMAKQAGRNRIVIDCVS
jgi:diguanylate cyclase (GGDEF)-like protein